MDKSEFSAHQVNEDDIKLKGLQNQGKSRFECADCGAELLVLQLVTTEQAVESEVLTRVAVHCCQCGGYSYVKQIPGQFYPGAPNDDMCFDVLDNDANAPEADVLFKAWKK